MNRILVLLFLISCSTPELRKQVFSGETHGTLLNLNSIRTFEEFDSLFCYLVNSDGEVPILIPFNFEDGIIDSLSNSRIPAVGHISHCSSLHCCHRAAKIRITEENNWFFDYDQPLSKESVDSIVRLNILNYGNVPFLSTTPQEAQFLLLSNPMAELTVLNPLLEEITKSYLRILDGKAKQTSLTQAIDSFPLNIIISTYSEPPLPDSVEIIEITEELIIDGLK